MYKTPHTASSNKVPASNHAHPCSFPPFIRLLPFSPFCLANFCTYHVDTFRYQADRRPSWPTFSIASSSQRWWLQEIFKFFYLSSLISRLLSCRRPTPKTLSSSTITVAISRTSSFARALSSHLTRSLVVTLSTVSTLDSFVPRLSSTLSHIAFFGILLTRRTLVPNRLA